MRGNKLTVGSLFSGIGGLDLGLERAGWEVKWQVEIDEWCTRVLEKHWPSVPRYKDIKEVSGYDLKAVDLIAGGFPCQPVSVAGKRKAQADSRWLWPEFLRIVSEVRPPYVLVENVPGLLTGGMAGVIGDLSSCGYDTEWDCIPAAAVGAPHLRYRVFIVGAKQSGALADPSGRRRQEDDLQAGRDAAGSSREVVAHTQEFSGQDGQAYANNARPQGRERQFLQERSGECFVGAGGASDVAHSTSRGRDTQSLRRSRPQAGDSSSDADSTSPTLRGEDWWRIEPNVGRVAHGIPARVDRLKGLGNAVVPQVAEWIGRRLIETLK